MDSTVAVKPPASKNGRRQTVFWRFFFMMLCILLLAVASLAISIKDSQDRITQNYLTQAQEHLRYNAERFSSNVFATSTLPEVVEYTYYYDYLRATRTGTLPPEYSPVLSFISNVLSKQMHLLSNTEECLLYFSNVNSISTRQNNYARAEDCFSKYIYIQDLDTQWLLEQMKVSNNYLLLPSAQITIGSKAPVRGVVYIAHKTGRCSVMTIYSEETILKAFSMATLPERSYLRITSLAGETLLEWPEAIPVEQQAGSYCLTAPMRELRAEVKLWLPRDYFTAQAVSSYRLGIVLILVTFVIGVVSCTLLSFLAVKPIRNLVTAYGGQTYTRRLGNELDYLDSTIAETQKTLLHMQHGLQASRLSQLFAGHVLSGDDEALLREDTAEIPPPFRVALIHASGMDQILLRDALEETLSEKCFFHALNTREIGVLFHGGDGETDNFCALLTQISEAYLSEGKVLYCGISDRFESMTKSHTAVSQARFSLSREIRVNIFRENSRNPDTITWLQYERLYQYILGKQEDEAVELMRFLARESYKGNCRETFYAICFMLHCIAEDMGLEFCGATLPEYDLSLLPWENMERLTGMVQNLFASMRQRQTVLRSNLQADILSYIDRHLDDSALCAATVANHFKIPEKDVHTAVKTAAGQGLNAYLMNLRMKHAGELLVKTSLSVIEVANHCGYRAESTFFRVFKKYYGITPLQYRQENPNV